VLSLKPFTTARLPRIIFGEGSFAGVAGIVAEYGSRALLVTGAKSFRGSAQFETLLSKLRAQNTSFELMTVVGEPSPQTIDFAVMEFRNKGINVVVGIGGGSVLDAAKAVAGLLTHGNSVMDHLEGVGREIPYHGPSTPFIAVPTTAGTGSEATKNSVLSVQGENGFKKSFRHECLVAQVAVVDPALLATCPPELIAANGMDAFTQLLESYVSLKANAFTDALAVSGMQAFNEGFFHAWRGGAGDAARNGRSSIAYASLLSGITLAQAGLGSVHGLASPLGAFFPIPHGVVCGTLVAAATQMNIRALRGRESKSPALEKFAKVGTLLGGATTPRTPSPLDDLVLTLSQWTENLKLPRLGVYGVKEEHVPKIVAHSRGSSMQTNPIVLTDNEVAELVRARL
jgi:alcohol dehydrogenase